MSWSDFACNPRFISDSWEPLACGHCQSRCWLRTRCHRPELHSHSGHPTPPSRTTHTETCFHSLGAFPRTQHHRVPLRSRMAAQGLGIHFPELHGLLCERNGSPLEPVVQLAPRRACCLGRCMGHWPAVLTRGRLLPVPADHPVGPPSGDPLRGLRALLPNLRGWRAGGKQHSWRLHTFLVGYIASQPLGV